MITAAALSRGLNISDLDDMTLGGLVDLIIEYNEMMDIDNSEKEKVASQKDFDAF